MSLEIYIPPYAEPVSPEEMKAHLKQDSDITAEDALIRGYTTASRDTIETKSGENGPRSKAMLATTFKLYLDSFPVCGYIDVPRVPLISVASVTYTDESGSAQTFSSNKYTVDTALGRIYLAYGENWPSTRGIPNAVTVQFVSGIAATFTVNSTTDVVTAYGRTFSNGDRVQVMVSGGSTGALPGGLSALTTYYVVNVSGSTFQLSATSGGSAIDITSAGTGTFFIGLDLIGFETLRSAIKLQTGRLFSNRGDYRAMNSASESATLAAIDSLVASQHA